MDGPPWKIQAHTHMTKRTLRHLDRSLLSLLSYSGHACLPRLALTARIWIVHLLTAVTVPVGLEQLLLQAMNFDHHRPGEDGQYIILARH